MDLKDDWVEKRIGILLFVLSLVLFFLALIINYGNIVIRYDSLFTLIFSKDSFFNIVKVTALDVHPPLHYFIVKVFINLGHFLHLSFTDIYLGKISSAIPILLLMGFSWKYLRHDIGELGAGLFSFSIITMPQLIWLLTDVRMYSWGMLFVTLAFYCAYRITIQESWKNYILLTFFTIIGAYTQYFCSVSIFGVYLSLFVYLYLNGNIKKIRRLMVSGFVSVLAFIPWILILIEQIRNVVNSYWIPPFNGLVFYKTVIYFLSASKLVEGVEDLIGYDSCSLDTLFLSILLISILGICVYRLLNDMSFESLKMRFVKVNFLIFGALILLLEIILGVLIGDIIGKPILYTRYLFLSIGVFWLSVCIIISKVYYFNSKFIFVFLLTLFLVGGGASSYNGLKLSVGDYNFSQDMVNTLNLIDPDDLVVDDIFASWGWREVISHHPYENTFIMEDPDNSDSFNQIYRSALYSQLNIHIFGGSISKRINDTLLSGHKVWIDSLTADAFYEINDTLPSKYLDNYHIKFYNISKPKTYPIMWRSIIEITQTPQ